MSEWINDCTISIEWCTDDVLERVHDRNINRLSDDIPKEKLTLDECKEVLARCLRRHDANHGITWDTLDFHISDIIEERNK
tara:strand:- start:180 stop:422 length:243 start_codon:yes stop_codon:yes gene_type:complete